MSKGENSTVPLSNLLARMGRNKNKARRPNDAGGRSFTEGGRAAKRQRKIEERIRREQDEQLAELQARQHAQAERDRTRGGRGAGAGGGALAAAAADRDDGKGCQEPDVIESLWMGEDPWRKAPSDDLKRLRKSLSIVVRGEPCPAPVPSVDDPGLPPIFSAFWRLHQGRAGAGAAPGGRGPESGGKRLSKPTTVQQQLWPAALAGLDCVAIAPTGSGKTLAFLLPGAARILHTETALKKKDLATGRASSGGGASPRMVVCVPTRELAAQIVEAASRLSRLGITCLALFGGRGNKQEQVDALLTGGASLNLVVGTPGRLLDLVDLGALSLARTSCLVLDEADMMLQLGFEEQCSRLVAGAPPRGRQTVLVSATFPQRLREAVQRWTRPGALATIRVGAMTIAAAAAAAAPASAGGAGAARAAPAAGAAGEAAAEAAATAAKRVAVASTAPAQVAAGASTALSARSERIKTQTIGTPLAASPSSSSSFSSSSSSSSSVLAVAPTISQRVHVLQDPTDKLAALDRFIARVDRCDRETGRRQAAAVLIFCNRIRSAQQVWKHLRAKAAATVAAGKKKASSSKGGGGDSGGFQRRGKKAGSSGGRGRGGGGVAIKARQVALLHGKLPQEERQQALQHFKAGKASLLVSTDLAARGLDVRKLPYVLNYDMPQSVEVYVHRVGRTGRHGEPGVAETFLVAGALPRREKAADGTHSDGSDGDAAAAPEARAEPVPNDLHHVQKLLDVLQHSSQLGANKKLVELGAEMQAKT